MARAGDLERATKRYRLDHLLLAIGARIMRQFDSGNPVETDALVQHDGPLSRRGLVTIAAWHLSDLAFLSTVWTHDFADRSPRPEDLVDLMNRYHERDGLIGPEWLNSMRPEDALIAWPIGMSQQQFWYQQPHMIRAEFNRQVEMLEFLWRGLRNAPNLDEVCLDATGFNLRQLRKLNFALYAVGARQTDITAMSFDGTSHVVDPIITAPNIEQLIDHYTADYARIRSSVLRENCFFIWPIVRTATGRRIVVNEYFLARKTADGPFWIIRDWYMSRSTRSERESFLRYFGELFDLYFEKLLAAYLPPESYCRVKPTVGQRIADWIIEWEDYVLIVELKSTFLPLSARRSYFKFGQLENYIAKLSEGVLQLDSTERTMDIGGTRIKLLVHYEPLFVSDVLIRPRAVDMVKDELNSTENIFFSDLQDMEMLVHTMSANPQAARLVLEDMLLHQHPPFDIGNGKEIHDALNRVIPNTPNDFVFNKIDHYSTYVYPDRDGPQTAK